MVDSIIEIQEYLDEVLSPLGDVNVTHRVAWRYDSYFEVIIRGEHNKMLVDLDYIKYDIHHLYNYLNNNSFVYAGGYYITRGKKNRHQRTPPIKRIENLVKYKSDKTDLMGLVLFFAYKSKIK